MIKQVYAVYDRVSQDVTGGLMVFSHDAPAIRIFVDALSDANTILAKHPADFDLVCVGELVVPGDEGDAADYVNAKNVPALFTSGTRVVLSGAAWLAQSQSEDNTK